MNKINYIQAIKRPFTDFKKFLIGIVLLLVPILNILTGFIVRGYQLTCSTEVKKKKYKLPEWTDYKNLFVIGVFSFLISLIYLLPALIILTVSLGSIVLNLIKTTEFDIEAIITSLTGAEVTGVFVAVILFALTSYIIPIALLEYLNKYKFKQAFKINIVLKKAFKWKYFKVVLLIIVYYIIIYAVFSLVMMLFGLIPYPFISQVISVILSSIISFIIGVTAFTLIGEVYPELK
ncbi:MAG: DUF4013 domain-containing protein [Nanoarchaeota archaeon]|nr:DUF4013 domain-containing protein [Nanoarchaeota archaeon]